MNKEKSKSKKGNAAISSNQFVPISPDEWESIIANALIVAEDKKYLNKKVQREEERRERRKALGYNDYSNEKTPKKQALQIINALFVLIKFFFLPRKRFKENEITISIMQVFPAMFFMVIAGILLSVSLVFGLYSNMHLIMVEIRPFPWGKIILNLIECLITFAGARLCFLASIEVMETEDGNYIFGLFACITSILSIIIALTLKNG